MNDSRSTPVHTGKPLAVQQPTAAAGVYPRAYGETSGVSSFAIRGWGLPPCIRGNHPVTRNNHFSRGSTPVHTGKPGKQFQIAVFQ